ncbi:unnamed protein product [Ostreobium quekettii]|uniref:DOT1 domain-containing protein n=1 Tax=Ostreobium quekettii TaxID=121088 RepID=A0A8S1IPR0_9CHLO|nr:unnamed protein product [Ostreobium quekettii]
MPVALGIGGTGGGGAESKDCGTAVREKDAKAVEALYHVMASIENKLGGGEGVVGVYGSITRTGIQAVVQCLVETCGMDEYSRLVDIGAGLGRPLMHAIVHPGVRSSWGVEVDIIKWEKAQVFIQQTIATLQKRGLLTKDVAVPTVDCMPVEQVTSLEPHTHGYSFWEGIPLEGKRAFGRLFAQAATMRAIAVVQRSFRRRDPAHEMRKLAFGPVRLMGSFPVKMSGSGRGFTAYVFHKNAYTQPLRHVAPPPAETKREGRIFAYQPPVIRMLRARKAKGGASACDDANAAHGRRVQKEASQEGGDGGGA